ncbi:single-stranded DNA-binding protein [Chitinophaga sp. Hz27]|uniref:single-stranded DNA-binding protein n=1 Tax=Chitinophaga sp. Hz27 TaxID=3347169 RepID=UPI0035D91139
MIKLQLIGHLGRDAMMREVNGISVLNFTIAVNERFKNAAGVLQERTTWVDCSLWERNNMAPYLQQGTLVYVEGSPRVEGYISNNTGAIGGALRLRVQHLQLLSKRDEERKKPIATSTPPELATVPEQEIPADDLPF